LRKGDKVKPIKTFKSFNAIKIVFLTRRLEYLERKNMVEIKLNAPICDHAHKITAENSGDEVIVKVETTCNTIKGIVGDEMKLTKKEAMGLEKDSKLDDLKEKSESQCFVPPAIATACGIASGRISERLAKNVENTEMIIEEEE